MNYIIKYLILSIIFLSCQKVTNQSIEFSLLEDGRDIKSSGKMLQDRALGFNHVTYSKTKFDTINIAVHGWASTGYEWVHPLRKLATSGNQTYYYRWNWNQCPESASNNLKFLLEELLKTNNEIKHINMFGHSYGGTMITALADEYFNVSVDIHSIASGLSANERILKKCPDFKGYDGMLAVQKHYQWRTVKEQDGAFKNLMIDPQLVNIKNSDVFLLPSSFPDGRRLGHNWSVEWVIDKFFKD